MSVVCDRARGTPRAMLVVTVLLGLVGCGDTSNRLPLAGTVKWQGRPLTKGSILFVPTADHRGPKVGAPIVEGKYQIEKARGATPGTYRVEVELRAGETAHAWWVRAGNRIYLPASALGEEWLVRHEMLHAILQRGSHPADIFVEACHVASAAVWRDSSLTVDPSNPRGH